MQPFLAPVCASSPPSLAGQLASHMSSRRAAEEGRAQEQQELPEVQMLSEEQEEEQLPQRLQPQPQTAGMKRAAPKISPKPRKPRKSAKQKAAEAAIAEGDTQPQTPGASSQAQPSPASKKITDFMKSPQQMAESEMAGTVQAKQQAQEAPPEQQELPKQQELP